MKRRHTGPVSDPEFRRLRALVAALTRDRAPHDPDLVEARRQLALARVEARVAAAVEDAPELPDDLSARLVELIRSSRAQAVPAA